MVSRPRDAQAFVVLPRLMWNQNLPVKRSRLLDAVNGLGVFVVPTEPHPFSWRPYIVS